MTESRTHVVSPRFCGPPASGNGGYVAGLIGEAIGGSAQVDLRKPPPLETPLEIVQREQDGVAVWQLLDGEVLVAEGRRATVAVDPPAPPEFAAAEAARVEELKGQGGPFSTCFVCGRDREEGDGLRIIPGDAGEGGLVASPWIPTPDLTDDSGRIAVRFMWAALDCPGGIAAMEGNPRSILLARHAVEIEELPKVGERCVAIGWPIAHEGRKHTAGSALFGADGRRLGRAEQLWIDPRT